MHETESRVNKAELVKVLESRLGSRKTAVDALEAVVDTIMREVTRGGRVSITGFGTFERVERAARTGRNPHTGEAVRIAKSKAPRFRAGTSFKAYVMAPRSLPKNGSVGGRAPASTSGATAGQAVAGKAASKKATATAAAKAPAATKATAKAATTKKAAAARAPAAKAATTKKATVKKAAAAKK